jgi:alkaline phosphatase D
MVRYLDSIVGILINNVSRLEVAAKMNYIILSDHGMADLDSNKLIVLEIYIKPSWVKKYYGYNPLNIAANDNCADSIYYALKKVKPLKVWKKGKLPKRLKYGNNDRIGDIVLVARNGWSLSAKVGTKPYGGAHGYDNSDKDMYGIFYALGPAFKKNYKAKTFENIYIYSIAAKILNIEPSVYHNKFKQLNRIIKH